MPKRSPRTALRQQGKNQRSIESQLLANALQAELDKRGMTAYSLANAIAVAHSQIYGLMDGSRNLTAVLSLKLGRYFEQDPAYWLALQAQVDLAHAMQAFGAEIDGIVPHKDRDQGRDHGGSAGMVA